MASSLRSSVGQQPRARVPAVAACLDNITLFVAVGRVVDWCVVLLIQRHLAPASLSAQCVQSLVMGDSRQPSGWFPHLVQRLHGRDQDLLRHVLGECGISCVEACCAVDVGPVALYELVERRAAHLLP